MGTGKGRRSVLELLQKSAAELKCAADNREAWDFGWCTVKYRRSPDARLSGPGGTYKLSACGVEYYEAAVELLLKDQRVRQRWDSDELWSIVGSMVVFLSTQNPSAEEAESQVARLSSAAPTTVLFPVANIQWEGAPVVLDEAAVLGEWTDPRFVAAVSALNNTPDDQQAEVSAYLAEQDRGRPMTGFATVVVQQSTRAFKQAANNLEQLCDVVLLLLRDKDRYGLYSMRGAWNRPGVRGLVLDRQTIEFTLAGTERSVELASKPLVLDELGQSSEVHWYSAEPLPLQKILKDPELLLALERTMNTDVGVATRIRLAARWYAEAFWALDPDDAVLALGVSLDALVGSRSGLPGRVMRDRYALLDPVPSGRRERAERYDEIFGVRSSVAHGGSSSKISEKGFIRSVEKDITWAAWRLIRAEDTFGKELAGDLDQLFDQLRWGTLCWPEKR